MMEESRRLRSSLSFNKLNSLSSGSLGKDTTVHLLRAGERRRLTTAISVKKSEQLAQAALLDEERNKKRIEKLRTFAGLDRPGHVDQEGLQKFVKQEDEAAHMEELRIKMRSRSMKVKGSASMKRLMANLPPGAALENMWGVDDISSEEREQQWAMEVEQQVQSERKVEFLQRTQLQDVRKQGVSEAASPPKRRLTSTGVPVSSLVPDLTPAEVQALRPQQDTSPRHETPVKPALKQPITSLEERLRRRSRAARMSFQVIPTVSLEQQAVSVSEPEVAEVEGCPEEPSPLMQHQPEPAEPEEEELKSIPAPWEVTTQECMPGPAISIATIAPPTHMSARRTAYRDRLAESVQKHLERTSRRTGIFSKSAASHPESETGHQEPQISRAAPAAQPSSDTTSRALLQDQVWLATPSIRQAPFYAFPQPCTSTHPFLATRATGGSQSNSAHMQVKKSFSAPNFESKPYEAELSQLASTPPPSPGVTTLVPLPHQVKRSYQRVKGLSLSASPCHDGTVHLIHPIGSPARRLTSRVLFAQHPNIDNSLTPSSPSYHQNQDESLMRESSSATSRYISQTAPPPCHPPHPAGLSTSLNQQQGLLGLQRTELPSTFKDKRSKWVVEGQQVNSQANRIPACIVDQQSDNGSDSRFQNSNHIISTKCLAAGQKCFLSDSDRQKILGEQKAMQTISGVEPTRTFTRFPRMCNTPGSSSEPHHSIQSTVISESSIVVDNNVK